MKNIQTILILYRFSIDPDFALLRVFSHYSDLTTSIVSQLVSEWPKPQIISLSHFLTFLQSTFNWDQLLTEIDFPLRLTFHWNWLLIDIYFWLRLTINWDQLSTEIDNDSLSTLAQFIATFKTFRLVMTQCSCKNIWKNSK